MRDLKNAIVNGRYVEMTGEEFKDELNNILNSWEQFIGQYKEKIGKDLIINEDYFINEANLYEVIKRVDKREAYYYVFHKMDKVCEYKHIAITCYWMCTLKPFNIINVANSSKEAIQLLRGLYYSVNERFSFYLILATIRGIFAKKYPDREFIYPNERQIKDIIYNFKYCDLSREAFIFFVETWAYSYGIGLDKLDISEDPNRECSIL